MAKTIPVLDLMFFLTETKTSPKHVAGLMLFKLPKNAGKHFVADLVAAYRQGKPVAPFNRVAKFPLLGTPQWVDVDKFDMKYHVQHLALPAGTTHEGFMETVAELHTRLLDRRQPCFRAYFIEGLPNRSFALYLQMHHAMVDGHSAITCIGASLEEDPASRGVRPVYAVDVAGSTKPAGRPRANALVALSKTAMKQTIALKDLYATLLRKGLRFGKDGAGSVPFTAPRGPTNAAMGKTRTVATLSLPIGEMKAVGKAFGGTLNDVAVTIVDAALNRYLQDLGAAPDKALVAMCPVSLRKAGDNEAATKVSSLFVPLGTRKAAIAARMQQVMNATTSAKGELRSMSKDAALLYAILAFGLSELAGVTRADAMTKPMANFVLSNVPGPRTDRYLGGAKMLGIYPISALGGGLGLNVTLLSYAESMDFGFVANGATMPDLDKLAARTGEAFHALRKAAAKRSDGGGANAAAPPPRTVKRSTQMGATVTRAPRKLPTAPRARARTA